MTPERWRRVEEVLEAARELAPEDRAAYLDRACAGNPSIRGEVESLLAHDEEAESFIEEPAFRLDPQAFGEKQPASLTGQKIGFYHVGGEIGRGGMGTVYLAEDTRLRRRVALKLLPEDFTRDKSRVRRFQQEARAASALNHPSILTIHDIGQTDHGYFIATEFVEGETLRARLQGRMSLGEVLEVAVQVASALQAAHKAGIVHRDIKPENVMVREDGIVKVLDFGLAKLVTRPAPQSAESSVLDTSPGVVMGTASYMSPEQARGQEVDARTDVWSLGVVIYEMATGHAPFEGETASDMIASVLKTEPPPLSHYSVLAPAKLQSIVEKALRKDKEERYQTISEMVLDLKNLRREVETEAEPGRAVRPSSGSTAEVQRRGQSVGVTVSEPGAQTDGVQAGRSTSGAEYIVGEVRRHKRGVALALGVLALILAGAALGLYNFISRRESNKAPFQAMKVTRLTTTGRGAVAALSPDGKYLAYAADDAGQQSIRLRHLATASDTQIVPAAEAVYGNLTLAIFAKIIFSPDGNYVYYTKTEQNNTGTGTIYRVPVLGGAPRKVIEGVLTDLGGTPVSITLSPDGRQLAFVRYDYAKGETTLTVADTDGGREQGLTMHKATDYLYSPAWSPDGRTIACVLQGNDARGRYTNIIGVPAGGGTETVISSQRWYVAEQVVWLTDGSDLLANAMEQVSSPLQIWHISYPGGEVRRITNDLLNYRGLSLTADSGALVTVQDEQISRIWVVPDAEAERARQVTSGRDDGRWGVCWTPDGEILYTSRAGGGLDIWAVDPVSGNSRQLTTDGAMNQYPSVSPDGRSVVFVSARAGTGVRNIWRMDLAGANPKQLTAGKSEWRPNCSPDGKWVVYHRMDSSGPVLYKVPIDGGEPVGLTDKTTHTGAVSPDGKMIACAYIGAPDSPSKMAVLSFANGQPLRVFDISPTAVGLFRWTPDGLALTYIDTRKGVSNIWSQPLDGGPPKQLTDFKSEQILNFDWSRDGKQLAVARSSYTSDVVLISDFR